MHIVHKFGHLFGGILLVAAISIGVGMLALPVATAEAGFFPSLAVYLISWLFMLGTGLLILEACIWMPEGSNLITLTHRLLGKWGEASCWVLYLFLFTCLMIAHIASGGNAVMQITHEALPSPIATLIYVLLFAPVVFLGTKWVDRFNFILMAGLILSYLLFVGYSVKHINFELLTRANWSKAWWGLPVVFTAFGYQSLIPTLMTYMNRNVKKVRLAIIIGTSIPLVIYVVWELIILGVVPLDGEGGLRAALEKGQNAIYPLGYQIKISSLYSIGQAFAFFAMTASWLGMSIAFADFLADGFKIGRRGLKKIAICGVMFGIPTLITLIYPQIFIRALGAAGGIGVALLLGLLPILMVWSGRYRQGYSMLHKQLPGGKILLSIMLVFVAIELVMQIF